MTKWCPGRFARGGINLPSLTGEHKKREWGRRNVYNCVVGFRSLWFDKSKWDKRGETNSVNKPFHEGHVLWTHFIEESNKGLFSMQGVGRNTRRSKVKPHNNYTKKRNHDEGGHEGKVRERKPVHPGSAA